MCVVANEPGSDPRHGGEERGSEQARCRVLANHSRESRRSTSWQWVGGTIPVVLGDGGPEAHQGDDRAGDRRFQLGGRVRREGPNRSGLLGARGCEQQKLSARRLPAGHGLRARGCARPAGGRGVGRGDGGLRRLRARQLTRPQPLAHRRGGNDQRGGRGHRAGDALRRRGGHGPARGGELRPGNDLWLATRLEPRPPMERGGQERRARNRLFQVQGGWGGQGLGARGKVQGQVFRLHGAYSPYLRRAATRTTSDLIDAASPGASKR
mmetsp:Transcript_20055/g.46487  ORF Transcript_20055/g.46487 Transcript_20055/m.46487 type:complete len:267 (-) Transcript_20055:390-1190(-)